MAWPPAATSLPTTITDGTLSTQSGASDHATVHNVVNQALQDLQNEVLGSIYTPQMFGATGNGATDDTAACAAAIAAAQSAGGGIVFFPVGTYLLSSSLPVGGGYPGGLTILGSGWDSELKLVNGADCYIFDFGVSGPIYSPGVVIRDLYLDCNGANQTAGGGIYARGAVWCKFDHLYIDTPWEAGIRFFQDGTGNYGHHNTVDSCRIVNGKNAAAGPGYALLVNSSDENLFTGCTFQDCGVSGQGESTMVYDTTAGLSNYIGCHWVGGGTGCSHLYTDSGPGRLRIIGGESDSPNGPAHNFVLRGTNHKIMGVAFLGVGQGATSGTYAGVYCEGATGTYVDGCDFTAGTAFSAAVLDSGATDTLVGVNTFNGTWGAAGPVQTAVQGIVATPPFPGFLTTTIAATEPKNGGNDQGSLASGQPFLVPIYLQRGVTIGHIAVISGGTGANTPTHQWFAICDGSYNMLAVTVDDTTGAWGSNAIKPLAIGSTAAGAASTFTPAYTGLYYLAVMVVANTVPHIIGANWPAVATSSGVQVWAGLSSTTGLTTPPTFPTQFGTPAKSGNGLYAEVAA